MCDAAPERWVIERGSGCVIRYWGYVYKDGKPTNTYTWSAGIETARIYSSAKNARNALSRIRKHRPGYMLGPVRIIRYIK
jgi:hypothetical protein